MECWWERDEKEKRGGGLKRAHERRYDDHFQSRNSHCTHATVTSPQHCGIHFTPKRQYWNGLMKCHQVQLANQSHMKLWLVFSLWWLLVALLRFWFFHKSRYRCNSLTMCQVQFLKVRFFSFFKLSPFKNIKTRTRTTWARKLFSYRFWGSVSLSSLPRGQTEWHRAGSQKTALAIEIQCISLRPFSLGKCMLWLRYTSQKSQSMRLKLNIIHSCNGLGVDLIK